MDPLVHAVVWSVGCNALAFILISGLTQNNALERLQSTLFVDVFRSAGGAPSSFSNAAADSEDLFVLAQRILGAEPARKLFDEMAHAQGQEEGLPHATDTVIARLERELSGSIGAASAHAMVTRIAGRQTVGMTELIDIADETQQLIETSRQLSEKSEELQNTAKQLRIVNERLRTLDAQKDDFLSQVSHELRTPMTSIRSFSEILMNDPDISETDKARFVSIIQDESLRLTRLLDEILDISRLEAGMSQIKLLQMDANDAVQAALDTVSGMTRTAGVRVKTDLDEGPVDILVNDDRLRQVMINVLSNAVKYNTASEPEIFVRTKRVNNSVFIDIIDNGGGVPADVSGSIFDKFTRGAHEGNNNGAGLGLAISLAIMRAMNGNLTLEHMPDKTNFFRLSLENPTANL